MNTSKLTRESDNKKTGMTLGEIENFIAHSKVLGIPEETPVCAVVGFGRQIQKLETR